MPRWPFMVVVMVVVVVSRACRLVVLCVKPPRTPAPLWSLLPLVVPMACHPHVCQRTMCLRPPVQRLLVFQRTVLPRSPVPRWPLMVVVMVVVVMSHACRLVVLCVELPRTPAPQWSLLPLVVPSACRPHMHQRTMCLRPPVRRLLVVLRGMFPRSLVPR